MLTKGGRTLCTEASLAAFLCRAVWAGYLSLRGRVTLRQRTCPFQKHSADHETHAFHINSILNMFHPLLNASVPTRSLLAVTARMCRWCRLFSISSELKLAVALPRHQSLWACAERHCSAARWRERKKEREEFWQWGAHSPCNILIVIPSVWKGLGDERLYLRPGRRCCCSLALRNPLSMKRFMLMSAAHNTLIHFSRHTFWLHCKSVQDFLLSCK